MVVGFSRKDYHTDSALVTFLKCKTKIVAERVRAQGNELRIHSIQNWIRGLWIFHFRSHDGRRGGCCWGGEEYSYYISATRDILALLEENPKWFAFECTNLCSIELWLVPFSVWEIRIPFWKMGIVLRQQEEEENEEDSLSSILDEWFWTTSILPCIDWTFSFHALHPHATAGINRFSSTSGIPSYHITLCRRTILAKVVPRSPGHGKMKYVLNAQYDLPTINDRWKTFLLPSHLL